MKQILAAAGLWLCCAASSKAQVMSRVYARPDVPPRAVLERLNLEAAWHTFVPAGGMRDGIFSIQVLPDQILVQMRSGMITVLNPEDGTVQWHGPVGEPYRVTLAPGYNKRSIFVYSGVRLYSLDRKTGALQWQFDPPHAPGAPPVADDKLIYLALGTNSLYAFLLPEAPRREEPKPAEEPAKTAPGISPLTKLPLSAITADRPVNWLGVAPPIEYYWDYPVLGRLEQAPLLADEYILVADSNGTFFVNIKDDRGEKYRFQANAPLSATLAQYGAVAYVPSRDFSVFALDIPNGRILWRFTADRNIVRKPAVTDEDLYVASEGAGIFRVDRETGRGIWRNTEAERFLALNKTCVYALDRWGRLLVLDRARGSLLSALDVRDFNVPVRNEVTDRVYLASNDGLIVCLHDRGHPKPLRVNSKAAEEKKPPAPAAEEKNAIPVAEPKAPAVPAEEKKAVPAPEPKKAGPAENKEKGL
jgi:outer membrane protein assembly factor BamB